MWKSYLISVPWYCVCKYSHNKILLFFLNDTPAALSLLEMNHSDIWHVIKIKKAKPSPKLKSQIQFSFSNSQFVWYVTCCLSLISLINSTWNCWDLFVGDYHSLDYTYTLYIFRLSQWKSHKISSHHFNDFGLWGLFSYFFPISLQKCLSIIKFISAIMKIYFFCSKIMCNIFCDRKKERS